MEYFPPYQLTTNITVTAIAAAREGELVSPEGAQGGNNTCHLAAIRPQPLLQRARRKPRT